METEIKQDKTEDRVSMVLSMDDPFKLIFKDHLE